MLDDVPNLLDRELAAVFRDDARIVEDHGA